MKASIDVLSNAPGRKIAVLGDMGELGAEEKQLHYMVGEHFAGKELTHFTVWEHSRRRSLKQCVHAAARRKSIIMRTKQT